MHYSTIPEEVMVTFFVGFPLGVPIDSIVLTTSMPSMTFPKTTCFPSSYIEGQKRFSFTRGDPAVRCAYPWSGDGGDEKLRAIGVTSGIGHGEQAGSGVLVLKVLIYRMRTFRKEPTRGGPSGNTL